MSVGTDAFELAMNEQGKLVLKRPGQEDKTDVRVRRAFPWSRPDRHTSAKMCIKGRELALCRHPFGADESQM